MSGTPKLRCQIPRISETLTLVDPPTTDQPTKSNTRQNLHPIMAAHGSIRPPPLNPHAAKRKFFSDNNDLLPKKRRATEPHPDIQTQNQTTIGSYSQIYNPLLVKLDRKFDIKTLSVMPSTSINKHVDRALEHLGRFNPWDQAVLPGVVLLCAKSAASSKLITISELIRRRIGESEQKWFQYNVLNEMIVEEPMITAGEPSVVEDTYMAVEGDDEEVAENEYFETRQPTIHEQAVQPAKVRYKSHLTVLLSRVPLDDLKTEPYVAVQTNEQMIEHLQKKKLGLVA